MSTIVRFVGRVGLEDYNTPATGLLHQALLRSMHGQNYDGVRSKEGFKTPLMVICFWKIYVLLVMLESRG